MSGAGVCAYSLRGEIKSKFVIAKEWLTVIFLQRKSQTLIDLITSLNVQTIKAFTYVNVIPLKGSLNAFRTFICLIFNTFIVTLIIGA